MSATSDEKKDTSGGEGEGGEESRGVKRSAEKPEINVHTANEWEHAHLEGGDERKQKFLRLMGAGKKEHTGKVTIGEQGKTKQHGRSDKEEEELKSKLEKEFEANLEYKLTGGARKHKGLGFTEVEKSTEEKEKGEEREIKESEGDVKESPDSQTADAEKSKSEEELKDKDSGELSQKENGQNKTTDESKTPDSQKKYSMSFVKAS